MSIWSMFLLAVGLSMDAFAVAVCKGLATRKLDGRKIATVGLWFGGFQALMSLLGCLLGTAFEPYIAPIDHWVAFVLLGLIGANMIRESRSKEDTEVDASYGFRPMLLMAVATSIDALAAGIAIAYLPAVACIGATTFVLSCAGVKVGNAFGARFKGAARAVRRRDTDPAGDADAAGTSGNPRLAEGRRAGGPSPRGALSPLFRGRRAPARKESLASFREVVYNKSVKSRGKEIFP